MKNLLIFFTFILTITNLYAQTEKEKVAVLDLKAEALSTSERITLSNRLRSELIKIDSFAVIDREKMNDELNKQGFQATDCSGIECALKAGKILNVKLVFVGSISRVGDIFTITLRIIDVKSGEVIKLVTEDCQCSIGQVLTSSIPFVAAKLSGLGVSENLNYNISKGKGELFIDSNPAGADIYIDNIKINQVTPFTIRGIMTGNHEVKIEKGEYIGLKIVSVFADDLVKYTIPLFLKIGSLMVYSDPKEADIYINNEYYGKTPKKVEKLPIGNYQIILKDTSGLIFEKRMEIGYNQITKVEAKLGEPATLDFLINPSVAKVYVDDAPIGEAKRGLRISLKESAVWSYKIYPRDDITIKIKAKYYETWEQLISLKPGDKKEIKVNLERETGSIQFSSYPDGAFFYANDKKIDIVNDEITMLVGNYFVEVSCPGYLDKEIGIIKISVKDQVHIDASLEKKTKKNAIIRSAILPGWGVAYQEKGKRALAYGISFIGSLGGSIYYTRQYNPAVKDYNNIRKEYEEALDYEEIEELRNKMNSKYDEVTSLETKRNIFYVATGVIWVLNMVDVLYFPPAWEQNIELSTTMKRDNILLGVTVNW